MSSTNFTSRAFIIGDQQNGLTIVVTDPVMVAHFSSEQLRGETDLLKGIDSKTQMAAIIREIIPTFRGQNVLELHNQKKKLGTDTHGTHPLAQEQAVQTELNFAETLAQSVENGDATVLGVNFCIGLTIEPCKIVSRPRIDSPIAVQVRQYLQQYGYCENKDEKLVSTHPQVFTASDAEPTTPDGAARPPSTDEAESTNS
jgi:hypothetical protein